MKQEEIMEIFRRCGAYKQGHFKLSSGLHSPAYLQCALVLQNPALSARLCSVLAGKFQDTMPDIIVGPAMGGIILAYEMARVFSARAVFTERNKEGNMELRRGFKIFPENKVLIAEDVLTTGKSVKEVLSLLKKEGVKPIGIASLVDRNSGPIDFEGIKTKSLIRVDIPTFKEEECPLCREGLPIEKPGSRGNF
ncbi:MAG: orotate phosphoribosyltransferase [Candidatus Omnitrophota bacterium]